MGRLHTALLARGTPALCFCLWHSSSPLRFAPTIVMLGRHLTIHVLSMVAEYSMTKQARLRAQVCVHKPPLPFDYGTHHSKAFVLAYAHGGVRVIVHTANLVFTDCNDKTQGIWYQDFPPLAAQAAPNDNAAAASVDAATAIGATDFQAQLLRYLDALKVPQTAYAPLRAAICAADFSLARAALVTSVPGRHAGPALNAHGHMRARAVLGAVRFAECFRGAGLALQYSSIGSILEPWLRQEFCASLCAGHVQGSGAASYPRTLRLARQPCRVRIACAAALLIRFMRQPGNRWLFVLSSGCLCFAAIDSGVIVFCPCALYSALF